MQQNVPLPMAADTQVDADTFRRVWDRVRPSQGEDCPLEVDPPAGAVSAQPSAPLERDRRPPVPRCSAQPPEPERPPVPHCPAQPPEQERPPVPHCPASMPGDTPPIPDGWPCSGCPSPCFTRSQGEKGRLEELMALSKEGAAASRLLARRTRGNAARSLDRLADQHRQALRQLSAVYFLILGRRHVPGPVQPRLPLPMAPALRRQFLWEQELEQKADQAAREVSDPCLRALYGRLAQQAADAAAAIQRLLEDMLAP